MEDYLIDALVLFFQNFSAWVAAVAITYALLLVVSKIVEDITVDDQERERTLSILKKVREGWKIVIVFGLIVSVFSVLTSSRLQFKRSVDSEHVLRNQQVQIQERYEETRSKPIVDLTRQPSKTEEERKSEFDDMVDWKNREK